MNNITIGLPCYNEEKNIINCIKEILKNFDAHNDVEILVVDNNSTDNTIKVVNDFVAANKLENKLNIIHNKRNITYSGSINVIIQNAKYENIGIMDSDGQYLANDFDKLFNKLNEGYDLVFGKRVQRNDTFLRKFISYVFKLLTQNLIKHNLTDLNCGIKTLKRNSKITNYTSIYINHANPELYCVYNYYKLKITEVPVSHLNRTEGDSIHNIFNLISTFFSVLAYLRYLKKKYSI